jgi:excisionase family DNA binding protein
MSGPSGKTTFTLPEAAKLLSCHRETLRRAIRTGELPAAKLGRDFRISRSDLQAFWTACGGGDLFGREEEALSEAQREQMPTARRTEKKARRKREVQCSLPGMEPGAAVAAAAALRRQAQAGGADLPPEAGREEEGA